MTNKIRKINSTTTANAYLVLYVPGIALSSLCALFFI